MIQKDHAGPLRYLLPVGLAAMMVAIWAVFGYAPNEKVMGIVQKIFYFHVSSAWTAYLAFFLVLIGSVGYLATRSPKWDQFAHASDELGVLFTTIVLLTGPLWGKAVWGAWWDWDPRLTTTLILWLIAVAYLLVRSFVDDREQAARYCAILGIVGALDIPIIHYSVSWWRSIHPEPIVLKSGGADMPPEMLWALLITMGAFTILFAMLVIARTRLQAFKERVSDLRRMVGARRHP